MFVTCIQFDGLSFRKSPVAQWQRICRTSNQKVLVSTPVWRTRISLSTYASVTDRKKAFSKKLAVKVAEHSFRPRSCWCDSVRAQGLQKQTCRWYSDHVFCSMPAPSLLFFFVIESSVLTALVFSNKSVLQKVTVRRTQQFSDFSISKEPS